MLLISLVKSGNGVREKHIPEQKGEKAIKNTVVSFVTENINAT